MSIIKKIRARFNTLRLVSDERGLSTVEYVILLVLIAALCVATWNALGTEIKAKLGAAGTEISGQTTVEYTNGMTTGQGQGTGP